VLQRGTESRVSAQVGVSAQRALICACAALALCMSVRAPRGQWCHDTVGVRYTSPRDLSPCQVLFAWVLPTTLGFEGLCRRLWLMNTSSLGAPRHLPHAGRRAPTTAAGAAAQDGNRFCAPESPMLALELRRDSLTVGECRGALAPERGNVTLTGTAGCATSVRVVGKLRAPLALAGSDTHCSGRRPRAAWSDGWSSLPPGALPSGRPPALRLDGRHGLKDVRRYQRNYRGPSEAWKAEVSPRRSRLETGVRRAGRRSVWKSPAHDQRATDLSPHL